MKCKRIIRNLPAYLDGELDEKEKQAVSQHLKTCPDCKKELAILSKQDEYLKQQKPIEPSAEFNAGVLRKARGLEESADNGRIRLPVLARLPVPAMGILILIIVFYMGSFSSALFAKGQDVKEGIASRVVEKLVVSRKLLNPVTLINLCEGCCCALCNCARAQGVQSECVCGKCGNQYD